MPRREPEPEADAPEPESEEAEEDSGAPLSERLVLDLTAHRTLALRDALATSSTVALSAVVHALALSAFYPAYERRTCLEIKGISAYLDGHAPCIDDTRAGRSVSERHAAWASRLPKGADDLWEFVEALAGGDLLDLLAHCASLTVNAVRAPFDRKPGAWAHADRLAEAVNLDMNRYWTATVASYLGRFTKAQIGEAVREAVSEEAAERISGLKKPEMASEAEAQLAGKGWLPSLLQAPVPIAPLSEPEASPSFRLKAGGRAPAGARPFSCLWSPDRQRSDGRRAISASFEPTYAASPGEIGPRGAGRTGPDGRRNGAADFFPLPPAAAFLAKQTSRRLPSCAALRASGCVVQRPSS